MSNKEIIYDSRGLAGFLCGYLSVDRDKCENEEWKQDLARILRRHADIEIGRASCRERVCLYV